MRGVISRSHLDANESLAEELNRKIKGFNIKDYSKIESIDEILLKRDISIERKKGILIKKLRECITSAFSIDRKKLNKRTFELFKKRVHDIRKIIVRLRSLNYYLETIFLRELKIPNIKVSNKTLKLRQQSRLARSELEVLEYAAYKLIGKVAMLDKRLLGKYSIKEERILAKEKIDVKQLGEVLGKETMLLEHLEAKMPPPRAAGTALMKEPVFTHWAARIFSLLSYLGHLHHKEAMIFSKLKKNKGIKAKISKKILQLIKEQSKLARIMEEKAISMENLHTLAAITSL